VGAKPAEATHFRYGHLTFKKIAPTTAEFTLTCAFRRSGYSGRAPDGFVAVGDRFSENIGGTVLNFGDNSFVSGPGGGGLTFLAIAIDPIRDYVIARATDPVTSRDRITHLYSAPQDPFTQSGWVANILSCCRIGNLQNNADDGYDVEAHVDLVANNSSPVSSLPPVIPVPQTGKSFFIPALDADEHTLRFRFATGFEAGSFGAYTQPPGATIDPLTGEYTVPPGLALGLWSTQVVIEEFDGSGNQIGQVGVDFIIQVVTPGPGSPPVFVYPPTPADGSVLTAVVGRSSSFLVHATDPDGDLVTLNTTGIPSGARQVATLPVVGSPAVSQFTWAPTLNDVGAYSITYTADDGNGGFTLTSITILVITGLDVEEPDGGEFYFVNTPMNIVWNNGGRLRANGLRIEISRDGGATYDSPPIAVSTPDDGDFTWNVTGPFSLTCRVRVTNVDDPTDYGISEADFTISDGRTEDECSPPPSTPIPDNSPPFVEIPLTFPHDLIIRSVTVGVDVTHPYVGDLELEVQHPDGTIVILHDETGEGSIDLNTVFGHGSQYTAPVEPLTVYNGKRSNGVWKLRVRDLNPGDIGQLDQWCLTVIGPDTGRFTVGIPNGGERWAVGTTQRITWDEVGVVGNANVQVSRDSGATWTTVGTVPAATEQFDWLVTGPETTHARVRAISEADPIQVDSSDADFVIQNPFMRVLQPNGGESISTGRVYQLRWDAVPLGSFESVNIELSLDGGTTWSTIAGGATNTGSFAWTPAPAQVTTQGRIRITSNDSPLRVDQSDANFTIQQPALTVTEPSTNDIWYTYTTRNIQWTTVGVTGNVNVEISRNGGATWELILVDTPNDGTADWPVTGPPTENAVARVRSIASPEFQGPSDVFAIREMSVNVTSPNGGESFGIDSVQNITWESAGIPGNVDIELSTDGGITFTPLFVDVPNGGAQSWTVAGPASAQSLIRVSAHGFPASDESDFVFAIIQPTISMIAPAGGEELRVGSSTNIQWTSAGVPGRVKIELNRSGTWETLFADTANDGSEAWTVTGPDSSSAVMRVVSLNNATIVGESPDTFTIVTPSITVTSANGGEQWFVGTLQTIRWNGVGFDGGVRIELTRDAGQTWETLFAQTNNDGSQDWVASGAGASNARFRITSLNQPQVTDQSNGPFSLVNPTITLGTPNGGQLWLVGRTQLITWNTVGVTGNLDIELSLDGGSTWSPLFDNTANDGSQPWAVTGAVSTAARIRITSRDHPTVFDVSDSSFTIAQASIRVTSPSGGAKWRVGDLQTITWEGAALAAGGTVDIQLSYNNGRSYQTIIQDSDNDGSATWQVSKKLGAKCKVKVIWKPTPSVFGVSGGTFKIVKAPKRRGR